MQKEPLTELLDAQHRVDAALRRFAVDPESALSALRDLNSSFAPHPHVIQALAICLYRAGQIEPALKAAREALKLCFDRGHSLRAAEIFLEMRPHLEQLGITREQLLTLALALDKRSDLSGAAKAYSAVIRLDAGESRAIKGLLQVADRILREKSKPAAAAKVYRYLLQHCSASPMLEFMQAGLQKAEKQLT